MRYRSSVPAWRPRRPDILAGIALVALILEVWIVSWLW